MIKPAALGLAVAMSAVSAGTYYGLDLLPAGTIPEPFGLAHKKEAPKSPATEVASVAPVAPAAPAPAAAPTAEPTEQDLAEEPPPPEPAAAAASEPAPAPVEQPAAAAPPAEEPKAAAAPKYETPPALREPEAAPKPKAKPKPAPTESTEVAKAEAADAPKTPKSRPPEADVIKPWWPDPSKMPANQLKLMYAGQVQGQEALALLFSADLNLDTVKQHAQVLSSSGQAVGGEWELGKNTHLAVFRGIKPGRYTVVLKPEVAAANGFMLGTTLKGPVYIKEP